MSHPRPNRHFIRRKIGPIDAILAPGGDTGLTAASLVLHRGYADQSPDEEGVAAFTSGMLKRGTAKRDSGQVAFDLESIGAFGGHSAGADACTSTLRATASDFPDALEIFFDCIRNPAFDPQELEVERQTMLAHLRRMEDEKFDYTYRAYSQQMFAGHGYGNLPEGGETGVREMSVEKCQAWHDKMFHPENMTFIAAGDFDVDTLCAEVEKHIDGWTPKTPSPARYDQNVSEDHIASSKVLHKDDLQQGFIVMGYRVPETTHKDYPALRLACAALGEGFTGRLFTNLRDKKSLAYAVGSALRVHRLGGHMILYIGTQPERLDESQAGLLEEAEFLRENVLSESDLARARQYVAGKYLMNHQSLASRIGHWASWEDSGAGAEYDEKYLEDLNKVTAEQIHEVARRWWVQPTMTMLRPPQEATP